MLQGHFRFLWPKNRPPGKSAPLSLAGKNRRERWANCPAYTRVKRYMTKETRNWRVTSLMQRYSTSKACWKLSKFSLLYSTTMCFFKHFRDSFHLLLHAVKRESSARLQEEKRPLLKQIHCSISSRKIGQIVFRA